MLEHRASVQLCAPKYEKKKKPLKKALGRKLVYDATIQLIPQRHFHYMALVLVFKVFKIFAKVVFCKLKFSLD